jgi:hypothetical protein
MRLHLAYCFGCQQNHAALAVFYGLNMKEVHAVKPLLADAYW